MVTTWDRPWRWKLGDYVAWSSIFLLTVPLCHSVFLVALLDITDRVLRNGCMMMVWDRKENEEIGREKVKRRLRKRVWCDGGEKSRRLKIGWEGKISFPRTGVSEMEVIKLCLPLRVSLPCVPCSRILRSCR